MTVVWHHEHHRHARHVAPQRNVIVRWLVVAGALVVFGLGGAWFLLVGWRSGQIPSAVERVLYVPIGIEEGHVLWYVNVARVARGIAAADTRTDVTESDYLQAISTVVRRNALEDIAQHERVTITDADVHAAVTWTDDVRAFESLATWSDREYLEYIVRGFALAKATESAVMADESYQGLSHKRMESIQEKIALGIAFPDLAKEYSEDPVTAQEKGSFGYVAASDVDPAFAPVFALPVNELSSVIATADAYWIVRNEEAVIDETGTKMLLRGIAVKKTGLSDVLDEKTSSISPVLWVR